MGGKNHRTELNLRFNIFNLSFGKDAIHHMPSGKAKKPSVNDVKIFMKMMSTCPFDPRGPQADESTKEGDFWLDGTGE